MPTSAYLMYSNLYCYFYSYHNFDHPFCFCYNCLYFNYPFYPFYLCFNFGCFFYFYFNCSSCPYLSFYYLSYNYLYCFYFNYLLYLYYSCFLYQCSFHHPFGSCCYCYILDLVVVSSNWSFSACVVNWGWFSCPCSYYFGFNYDYTCNNRLSHAPISWDHNHLCHNTCCLDTNFYFCHHICCFNVNCYPCCFGFNLYPCCSVSCPYCSYYFLLTIRLNLLRAVSSECCFVFFASYSFVFLVINFDLDHQSCYY